MTDHKDSKENYPEVEKVVLPIEEILQNYYSMESKGGRGGGGGGKNLKNKLQNASWYIVSTKIFLFLFYFLRNLKANCDISCSFLFDSMVDEYK